MSELTIDDAVAAVLSATRGEVVLRDSSGKVIGRFCRTTPPDEIAARNPFTLEEVEEAKRRAAADGPGVSFEEMWRRIRAEAGQ